MRLLILALFPLLAIPLLPVNAMAEDTTLCGQRSSDYMQSNGAVICERRSPAWGCSGRIPARSRPT